MCHNTEIRNHRSTLTVTGTQWLKTNCVLYLFSTQKSECICPHQVHVVTLYSLLLLRLHLCICEKWTSSGLSHLSPRNNSVCTKYHRDVCRWCFWHLNKKILSTLYLGEAEDGVTDKDSRDKHNYGSYLFFPQVPLKDKTHTHRHEYENVCTCQRYDAVTCIRTPNNCSRNS